MSEGSRECGDGDGRERPSRRRWVRTRAAVTVALGEMSVLETAWAAWHDLETLLGSQ